MAIDTIYAVVDHDLIIKDMIDEAVGAEINMKTSIDDSKCILKFNTKFPNSMSGYKKYNHTEILQFLSDNSADWEAGI